MSLVVKDLQKKYGEKTVVDHLSFSLEKPGVYALLGTNGAGKTTLVRMLLRLYDPNNGSILINGKDYRDIDPKVIRNVVGAVFQNVETYACTIAENVLLRKIKTQEDIDLVNEALKFSGLYETVYSLPDNINTELSREFNKGHVLSQGQNQRLAIARGYAQNFELFILDEPSSALDPLAEAQVYNNMLELGKNKTIVFISHRLTTTTKVDKIYLFEDGKITEEGTHDELMQNNKLYRKMFVSQSHKYLGEEYEK